MKIFHICLTSRQKCYFFIFRFNFDDFLTAIVKNLMKRPSVFMIYIKSLYKLLLSHKDLRSRNIWQWNDGLKNLYGNTSSLFVFIKRKKLLQHDIKMIHIKCIAIIPFNEVALIEVECFRKNSFYVKLTTFFTARILSLTQR